MMQTRLRAEQPGVQLAADLMERVIKTGCSLCSHGVLRAHQQQQGAVVLSLMKLRSGLSAAQMVLTAPQYLWDMRAGGEGYLRTQEHELHTVQLVLLDVYLLATVLAAVVCALLLFLALGLWRMMALLWSQLRRRGKHKIA